MFIFNNNIGKNDICDTYMQISQNGGHRNQNTSGVVINQSTFMVENPLIISNENYRSTTER